MGHFQGKDLGPGTLLELPPAPQHVRHTALTTSMENEAKGRKGS